MPTNRLAKRAFQTGKLEIFKIYKVIIGHHPVKGIVLQNGNVEHNIYQGEKEMVKEDIYYKFSVTKCVGKKYIYEYNKTP